MRRAVSISTWILFAVSSAIAQNGSPPKADPSEPWRASAGDFHVMMIFTDDPEKFLKEWRTPPDSVPVISSVEAAHRGDTVVAFVFFTGCVAKKGNCDSEVDFKMLRPDGSVYAEHSKAELWKGKPPPPGGNLQLSVANLGFKVELEDPLGKYNLKAVIRDRNAKVELALERKVEVLPKQ